MVTALSPCAQTLSQVSCRSSPGEQHDWQERGQWSAMTIQVHLPSPLPAVPHLQKSLWASVCSRLLHFKRQICSDGSMSSEFVMLTVCLVHVDFIGSILRTSKSWMKNLTGVGLVTNIYKFFLLEKAPITDDSPFLQLLFDIFQYSQFWNCLRCFLLILHISSFISRNWISLGLLL